MTWELGVMRKDCNSKALPFHWPGRAVEMNQWFYHWKEEESGRRSFTLVTNSHHSYTDFLFFNAVLLLSIFK